MPHIAGDFNMGRRPVGRLSARSGFAFACQHAALRAALSTSASRLGASPERHSLLPSYATIRRALLCEAGEGEADMPTSERAAGSKRADKARSAGLTSGGRSALD